MHGLATITASPASVYKVPAAYEARSLGPRVLRHTVCRTWPAFLKVHWTASRSLRGKSAPPCAVNCPNKNAISRSNDGISMTLLPGWLYKWPPAMRGHSLYASGSIKKCNVVQESSELGLSG